MQNLRFVAYFAALAASRALFVSPVAAQEDLDEVLERFDGFVAEGNYPKALEELELARRALIKAHHARIESLFPARLGDTDGEVFVRQEVFGMTSHTRRYVDAAGDAIEVALIEGGIGTPDLAIIEQLSRLLGTQVNAEPLRIDGRTATLVPEDVDGNAVLTVRLEAGGILRFTAPAGRGESLEAAARAFGVGTLDAYLSGDDPAVKSTI